MTMPMLLPFLVFAAIPLVWLVWMSFTSYTTKDPADWVGLENYRVLLADPFWWRAVRNTLYIAGVQTVVQVTLGLLLAVLVKRTIRGSNVFRTIFFLPFVTAVSVIGVIFSFLLRPHRGIINSLLVQVGAIDQAIDFLGSKDTAMMSIIVVSVWSGFGITMVLFLAGMESIPKDIYEAGEIDGAGAIAQFWYLTLPLLRPIVVVITLLSIVSAVNIFDVVKTLTGSGPAGATQVINTYMYSYFFSGTTNPGVFEIGYASSVAVTSSILTAIVGAIYLLAARKRNLSR